MPSSGRSAISRRPLAAPRTAFLVALCALVVLTTAGCRGLSRIGDCQKLVGVVSEEVQEIRKVAPKNGTLGTPEQYRALGPLFVGLAKKLEELELGDTSLQDIAKQSARRFRDSARYTGQFAYGLTQATESKPGKKGQGDKGRLSRLRRRMAKINKKQREDAKRVRSLCRPKK